MERLRPTLDRISHAVVKGWDGVVPRRASVDDIVGRALRDGSILGLGARTVKGALDNNIGYEAPLFLLLAGLFVLSKAPSEKRKR